MQKGDGQHDPCSQSGNITYFLMHSPSQSNKLFFHPQISRSASSPNSESCPEWRIIEDQHHTNDTVSFFKDVLSTAISSSLPIRTPTNIKKKSSSKFIFHVGWNHKHREKKKVAVGLHIFLFGVRVCIYIIVPEVYPVGACVFQWTIWPDGWPSAPCPLFPSLHGDSMDVAIVQKKIV